MKSNMKVNVGFLAGTKLEDAIEEAKQKAALWQVAFVGFHFNGTSFSISSEANIPAILKKWETTDSHPYGIHS